MKNLQRTLFRYVILSVVSIIVFQNLYGQVTPGDTIHAIHYVIDLQEIDTDTKTITASTTVMLTPLVDNLDEIPLDLMEPLVVDAVFVDGVEVQAVFQNNVVCIPTLTTVSVGDTFEVQVQYHGEPFHESWGGFHYSGSYAFNLGVGISWIPHNLGKTWFPCIDDFTDRATYDVLATVPDGKIAVGGGELVEVVSNGNGTSTYHWYLAQPVPTYLVSVAVGEYALVEDTYDGLERTIPITYYVKPADTSKVPGSFERIHEVMALFENSFGAYSWHRVGYVGTALGAMEHATNIAYPNFCITGNAAYESLYTHELSHMWFGDKVTCDKAEEMWINEGWATFCQYYYVEALDGVELFKTQMRDVHASVLQSCHTEEGGYHPLNNIPQEYTYGTSAYDKGATVVQAMRAYLGDEVFFEACKSYLDDLAFTSVSSYDMEANFTANSGTDMAGFFNNWVYHGGTPHYSIDSFSVIPHMGTSDVTVYVKQKRKGPAFTGNDNRIAFTVMDNQWNAFTDTIHFSGASGHTTCTVPFYPEEVFLDLEERYFDATVDNYRVIRETGEVNFPETYFSLEVFDPGDSAFVQATHNWAPPDTFAEPVPDLRLSDYRYWTVKGLIPETFNAKGRFFYSKTGLDNTLILSESDSVVILYRKDAGMEWEAVDFTVLGTWSIGYIYVENLQMGEYTLGVWDISVSDPEIPDDNDTGTLKIFPNPSTGKFTFDITTEQASALEIYSMEGKLIDKIPLRENHRHLSWDPDGLPGGTYLAVTRGDHKQSLDRKKFIYLR